MRGFVFACNALKTISGDGRTIGLPELGDSLIQLAGNYYWPLLEEIQPKLGKYEPMVAVARVVGEQVFPECAQKARNPIDMLVHRDLDERLALLLHILEYAGFISKREASRAMKSGDAGRVTCSTCATCWSTRAPPDSRRNCSTAGVAGLVRMRFSSTRRVASPRFRYQHFPTRRTWPF